MGRQLVDRGIRSNVRGFLYLSFADLPEGTNPESSLLSIIPHQHHLEVSLLNPSPSFLILPYPIPPTIPAESPSIALPTPSTTTSFTITYSRALGLYTFVSDQGLAAAIYPSASSSDLDVGSLGSSIVHLKENGRPRTEGVSLRPAREEVEGKASCSALNAKFCMLAVGTES